MPDVDYDVLLRALRYAGSRAIAERARGRFAEERNWLDMCALLEPCVTSHYSHASIARATERDAATLTDKEIELREWLRSQPGGAEWWTVVKAGFRRSYDMGLRDARASVTPPPEVAP